MRLFDLTSDWLLEHVFLTENKKVAYLARNMGAPVIAAAQADPKADLGAYVQGQEEEAATAVITQLLQADPMKGKFLQFIVRMYVAQEFKMEDIPQLRQDLTRFKQIAKKLDPKDRDINRYPDLRTLYTVLRTMEEVPDEELLSKRQSKIVGQDDYEVVFDSGKTFKVFIPRSRNAACALGSGTRWCTAADSASNMYDEYAKEDDLYVINVMQGGNLRKFQLHFQAGQFMDEDDKDLSEADIKFLSQVPAYTEFLNMLIQRYYGPYMK